MTDSGSENTSSMESTSRGPGTSRTHFHVASAFPSMPCTCPAPHRQNPALHYYQQQDAPLQPHPHPRPHPSPNNAPHQYVPAPSPNNPHPQYWQFGVPPNAAPVGDVVAQLGHLNINTAQPQGGNHPPHAHGQWNGPSFPVQQAHYAPHSPHHQHSPPPQYGAPSPAPPQHHAAPAPSPHLPSPQQHGGQAPASHLPPIQQHGAQTPLQLPQQQQHAVASPSPHLPQHAHGAPAPSPHIPPPPHDTPSPQHPPPPGYPGSAPQPGYTAPPQPSAEDNQILENRKMFVFKVGRQLSSLLSEYLEVQPYFVVLRECPLTKRGLSEEYYESVDTLMKVNYMALLGQEVEGNTTDLQQRMAAVYQHSVKDYGVLVVQQENIAKLVECFPSYGEMLKMFYYHGLLVELELEKIAARRKAMANEEKVHSSELHRKDLATAAEYARLKLPRFSKRG